MKKTLLLTPILIFTILNINAQEFDLGDANTSSPFIVMHVDGSAKYTAKGSSNKQNVVSGMILPGTGTLELHKKTKLKLSWQNQSVTLSKKGTYSLKNEAKKLADAGASAPASTTDDFLVELGAASGFGGSGDDGDGGRDSGAQTDTTGGSGWGTSKNINPIMPIGGVVPLRTITFSWAGGSEDDGYRINVYKGSEVVFSAMTKNNSFSLDISQLSVAEKEAYSWEVENVADSAVRSEKTTIEFVNKDRDKDIIRGMLSDREYSYSDPWLKLLREAHALQKENLLYSANEKYQQGLEDYSDNQTIKKMYARFLTNQGLGAMADSVFE